MTNRDILYIIALQKLKGLGNVSIKRLVDIFGSAQAVFEATKVELIQKAKLNVKIIDSWNKKQALTEAQEEFEIFTAKKILATGLSDANYPYKLRQINDAPAVLYYKGELNWTDYRYVAVVGTRKTSNYGLNLCKEFIKGLSESGKKVVIVSGGAAGIDTCAHHAAVDIGVPTLAVLGHGLNTIYPASNRELAKKILQNGALLTEFSYGSQVIPENFARRNRIIAGLSDACVVVESGIKGGSLITADLAFNYNRDVFTFPGRVGDSKSAGCNALVKRNMAGLIENADDFLKAMNWTTRKKNKEEVVQKELFISLNDEEQLVYDFLKQNNEQFIDVIAQNCELSMNKLSTILLNLEFKGVLKSLPGKYYELSR